MPARGIGCAAGASMRKLLDYILPLLLALVLLGLWQWIVTVKQIPPYVLPSPSAIFAALGANWSGLSAAMATTLFITLKGFIGAFIAAVLVAVLFSQSRLAEKMFYPY